ncbi:hypothetical protein GLOIN_2v1653803 [Rhizophagus irregularis DAOM 181602=DAOM 197198]|nr:hypothetical protein GLOIN_2v1653803 [Rhizophagus irregularis DAOM 181602=DAOM 197198]
MFKNELLIKYTEFLYGIYRNVHKVYTKRILSVYIFLIGLYFSTFCIIVLIYFFRKKLVQKIIRSITWSFNIIY